MAEASKPTAFSPEQWEKIKELFDQVSEVPQERREALLESSGQEQGAVDYVRYLLQCLEPAASRFEKLQSGLGDWFASLPLLDNGQVLARRFEISSFVARGGMGEVYTAEDLELGGIVAVKVLRPGTLDGPAALQRFRDEIRLARQINHPQVCRVYDVARHEYSTGDALCFFTMEYVDGETLSARLARKGAMRWEEAKTIIEQIAGGLSAAHAVGVIHRDIKSANIQLKQVNGETGAVLMDFGISAPLERVETGARGNGMTPAYAAPEQLQGLGESAATDQYSFGVVVAETLTGMPPLAVQSRQALRSIEPLRVRRAVEKALAPKPEERFASVAAFAEAMGFGAAREDVNRSRRYWLLAGGALAAGPAGWWLSRKDIAEKRPNLALASWETEDQLRFLADGLTDRLSDQLRQIPGLRLLNRMAVGGTETAKLSQLYGVDLALLGKLTSSAAPGAIMRLRLVLVHPRTNAEIWSGSFEGTAQQMDASVLEAVRAIIPHLEVSAARKPRNAGAASRSEDAYRQYLLGRYHASKRNTDSLRAAITAFEKSLEEDPNFGEARAWLALTLHLLSPKDGVDWRQAMAQSDREARVALEINSASVEARLALGANAQVWRWAWKEAEEHFRAAIANAPSAPGGHHWYSRLLYPLRRHREALTEIDIAKDLDPQDRSIAIARGSILLYQGRTQEAIEQYRFVEAAEPAHSNVYVPLSRALEVAGDYQGAAAAAQRAVELTGRASFALSQMGHVYAISGDEGRAGDILVELENRHRAGRATASEIAAIHAGRRDAESSLQWLELGLANRDYSLPILLVDPHYAFLRSQTRFEALAKQVGLN